MATAKKTEPRWVNIFKKSTKRYEQGMAKVRQVTFRNPDATTALNVVSSTGRNLG